MLLKFALFIYLNKDCSIKNKERDQEEKRRKDLNNASLSLRDARFPNSESRKRKGDGFLNHQNESTGQIRSNPQKSPLVRANDFHTFDTVI